MERRGTRNDDREEMSRKLLEALPELVRDIQDALIRLGRGSVADQLQVVTLEAWSFDEFARSAHLDLGGARDPGGVEETIWLSDDIGVNVDLDRNGRVIGLEVSGYEDSLSRLAKDIAG